MSITISIKENFKSSRTARGSFGERAIVKAFKKLGYVVSNPRLSGSDVFVTDTRTGNTIKIEVKFASQGNDGKWRAVCIKDNGLRQDHRCSDFIILLCQLPMSGGKCVPFIIPTAEQGNKPHIVITSNPLTYSGQYSKFRNMWTNIIQ